MFSYTDSLVMTIDEHFAIEISPWKLDFDAAGSLAMGSSTKIAISFLYWQEMSVLNQQSKINVVHA